MKDIDIAPMTFNVSNNFAKKKNDTKLRLEYQKQSVIIRKTF